MPALTTVVDQQHPMIDVRHRALRIGDAAIEGAKQVQQEHVKSAAAHSAHAPGRSSHVYVAHPDIDQVDPTNRRGTRALQADFVSL